MGSGNLESALQLIDASLRERPDEPVLLWKRVVVLISSNELVKARVSLERLKSLDPFSERITCAEGLLLHAQGHWLEAQRKLESLGGSLFLDDVALPSLVLRRLGECYLEMGQVQSAEKTFRDALRLNPYSVESRLDLARVLAQTRRLDEALAAYHQIEHVQVVPLQIAQLLIQKNLELKHGKRNWDEINQILNSVVQQEDRMTDVLLLRAEVHLINGESGEAKRLLDDASRRDPGDVKLWVARAISLPPRRPGCRDTTAG